MGGNLRLRAYIINRCIQSQPCSFRGCRQGQQIVFKLTLTFEELSLLFLGLFFFLSLFPSVGSNWCPWSSMSFNILVFLFRLQIKIVVLVVAKSITSSPQKNYMTSGRLARGVIKWGAQARPLGSNPASDRDRLPCDWECLPHFPELSFVSSVKWW